MERFIDQALSALFKVADYVTSRRSLTSSEPVDGTLSKTSIRFSKEDIINDTL